MRDGTGKPVFHTAPRARGCDLDPVCEPPYGPAANDWPHLRPNRCQHPTTRDTNLKISLAPSEASTDENFGVQLARRKSFSIPFNLKTKRAGDSYREKRIEKPILRKLGCCTFSRSLGP